MGLILFIVRFPLPPDPEGVFILAREVGTHTDTRDVVRSAAILMHMPPRSRRTADHRHNNTHARDDKCLNFLVYQLSFDADAPRLNPWIDHEQKAMRIF